MLSERKLIGTEAHGINLRVQLEKKKLKLHWNLKTTLILEQIILSNVTLILGRRGYFIFPFISVINCGLPFHKQTKTVDCRK
jgi:hypothetical protein